MEFVITDSYNTHINTGGRPADVQIEHLEECLHLAQTLNFTQTARHFGIAQPALSKHISNLEKSLDTQIFARDTHHVRLTKMGHIIIKDIASVVGAYTAMLGHAERLRNETNSSLTVSYLRGAAGKLIPAINDEFLSLYPDTEMRYRVQSWPAIFDGFISGDSDIAICGGTSELLDRKFERSLLFIDPFYAIVPPKHPLENRQSLEAKDLIGHKIFIPSNTFLPDETESISEYLYECSEDMDISTNILDFESVPMLLRLGNAVNISASNVRYLYNDDELKYIPLSNCPLGFPVYIYWKTNAANSQLMKYVDIVKRHFKKEFA